MKQLYKVRYILEVPIAAESYDEAKEFAITDGGIKSHLKWLLSKGPSSVYKTNHIPPMWSMTDIPFNETQLTFQDYLDRKIQNEKIQEPL